MSSKQASLQTERGAAEEPPARTQPTREVILDTAERLFAIRGVDRVAVRDLAREMNLTAPSLYNHFPGKQALYDAVLERGLRPILEILSEAWHPGGLRAAHVAATVDRLVSHLARHPHLARLLQRALLEEEGGVPEMFARWISPLYREGFAVIREIAAEAGWEPDEFPHVALGLFGLVFAYFTDVAALELAGAPNPITPRSVEIQRRFLEKAIVRLLGSQAATSSESMRDRTRAATLTRRKNGAVRDRGRSGRARGTSPIGRST